MASTIFLLIVSGLLFASPSYARRKRSALENPIDNINAQANFNPHQFVGEWKLDTVASECTYLKEAARTAYGVNIVVSINDTSPQSLWVSTFYAKKGVCWEIKQLYLPTKTPGRYLLTDRGLPVDIVIGETDYSSYAIIFFQKAQQLSVKLYVRGARLYTVLNKFAEVVANVGLNREHSHDFRKYGYCHKANQFHILDETNSTPESL